MEQETIVNQNMNQNINDEEITIDLVELFMAVKSKLHIILLSGIIMAFLAFMGTKLLITPMYTSETSLYVLSRQESSSGITYSELQSGSQLTKDYAELVTSRMILERVIEDLDLDMNSDELAGRITAEIPADTRFLVIRAEDENPEKAKEIADVLRETVSDKITEIMHAESVDTIDEGSLPTEPSSPNCMKNMMLGGIAGILIPLAIIVWKYIRDDTIKTPDDLERYLGLNTLTSIPARENGKKSKKSKSREIQQSAQSRKR